MRAKNVLSVLLFTAVLISCMDASAQNYHRGMKHRRHFHRGSESGAIWLGPVAGANMANVTGDGAFNNANKLGFHAGFLADFCVVDYLIVEMGVLYSVKGFQSDTLSKVKLNLNYIEAPLNAKVKLDNGLTFFAGPYVAMLMSANVTDGTNTIDVKKYFVPLDFGINGGIGYQMRNGFGIRVHYELGLANINANSAGEIVTPNNTNTNIQLSLMYLIRLN